MQAQIALAAPGATPRLIAKAEGRDYLWFTLADRDDDEF
jgi:hypothetical protein